MVLMFVCSFLSCTKLNTNKGRNVKQRRRCECKGSGRQVTTSPTMHPNHWVTSLEAIIQITCSFLWSSGPVKALKCGDNSSKVNDKTFTHSQNKCPGSGDVWLRHWVFTVVIKTKMSQSGLSFTKHAVKTSGSDSENDLAFHYLSVSISKESH